MSAAREAALSAQQKNDAQRVAAVLCEESATKRLQAGQKYVSDLADKIVIWSPQTRAVVGGLCKVLGLWFPEESER